MTQRLDYKQASPKGFAAMLGLEQHARSSGLDHALLELVKTRVSQINGCAFCLDMHVKEAKIHGESELRLHHVAIWHESNLFAPRERAALAWTEAVTRLPEGGIPDALFDEARSHFSEKELSDLTFAIMVINAWNRVAIAFKAVPGSADKLYGLDKAGLS